MTGAEIRRLFLDYFASYGHTIVPSSPLIPQADPTLLFTNAGMVQFKSVFLGEEKRAYARAASSQKCVRAGGKHNDLENVGRTARHHTFFEMLGNFSFGDYFKAEAIQMAWELLVARFGLDPSRLWITVFRDDDEAANLWRTSAGVPADRIVRMGEKDNFWAMGETGPCGPCSEIIYDQGESVGCGKPTCAVGCECDRFLEIWNLVFMQFNRDAGGTLTSLPRPSIDTGMGLERITAVLQDVRSNYDTDLLRPLIAEVEKLCGHAYSGGRPEDDVSMRVIADHVRAVTFLISDGALPSNEFRGHILRKILRRAARHGKRLGLDSPFLHCLSGNVIDLMAQAYPELARRRSHLSRVIRAEEERFAETLGRGIRLFEDEVGRVKAEGQTVLPGRAVFLLYDTYGFHPDLTADLAAEQNLSVDTSGFEAALEEQRLRGKESWKGAEAEEETPWEGVPPTEFLGYKTLSSTGQVLALMVEGEPRDEARDEESARIVVDRTPFYAESGGQIGDAGILLGRRGAKVEIQDTQKLPGGLFGHDGKILSGIVRVGDRVKLEVDAALRARIRRNHTATHLMHAALRETLGEQVKQSGSLVAPDRLRFDFTHFTAMLPEEIAAVETRVNKRILANELVHTRVTQREEALAKGALAFFEEKYGEQVRMVSVEGFSRELCGGTHVARTGDIGLFKILREGAVAAGIRRIEAVTGDGVLVYLEGLEREMDRACEVLRAPREGLVERAAKLVEHQKELERKLSAHEAKAAEERSRGLADALGEVAGVPLLVNRVETADPRVLRDLADKIRRQIPSGILVLGGRDEGKALLLVSVSPDLTMRFHAGKIVRELAAIVGGAGGGRPDFAQAGGPRAEELGTALERAPAVIEKLVGSD